MIDDGFVAHFAELLPKLAEGFMAAGLMPGCTAEEYVRAIRDGAQRAIDAMDKAGVSSLDELEDGWWQEP